MENEVKVKVWSLVKEGVYDLWTDTVLRIDSSKAPEPVEVKRKDADCVKGIRHRLQVPGQIPQHQLAERPSDEYQLLHPFLPTCCMGQGVQVQDTKPVPCNGKAVAMYGGSTAEARFTPPVASTQSACTTELALIGWLTIGHLATDGIAVQVRSFTIC